MRQYIRYFVARMYPSIRFTGIWFGIFILSVCPSIMILSNCWHNTNTVELNDPTIFNFKLYYNFPCSYSFFIYYYNLWQFNIVFVFYVCITFGQNGAIAFIICSLLVLLHKNTYNSKLLYVYAFFSAAFKLIELWIRLWQDKNNIIIFRRRKISVTDFPRPACWRFACVWLGSISNTTVGHNGFGVNCFALRFGKKE